MIDKRHKPIQMKSRFSKSMKPKPAKPAVSIQDKIVARLEHGDKIGRYPTGNNSGYDYYYRFESDKATVSDKTYFAMIRKGLIRDEHILNGGNLMPEIINPKNAPRYYNI